MKKSWAREIPQRIDVLMKVRRWLRGWAANEDLNFLLTNRVPRLALTRFMGRFSRVRVPWVRDASIAVWKAFTDLDLSDARKQRFDSLHDVFTRELREGARVVDPDPDVLASPCDAIVGACGPLAGLTALQAKGMAYSLADLLGSDDAALPWRDGTFVTLRLTSAMYHRFHAPADAVVERVTWFRGDTWNVNPIALARIERLFCRNERAAITLRLADGGEPVALVAVAAILVASLRLRVGDLHLHQRYRGPQRIDAHTPVARSEELGHFEHGSTIIVLVPPGFALAPGIEPGARIAQGRALLRRQR
jgi:phosphatidylserine decarboxylase